MLKVTHQGAERIRSCCQQA